MSKKQNNLIGRPVTVDFACRWKSAKPEYQASLRSEFETRDDYGKTGEIVDYNIEDYKARVLFQDGQTAEYYIGELTITGPSREQATAEQQTAVLIEIRELLTTLVNR